MSDDFKFIRDFKIIDWKLTIQVNAIRAEFAGLIWLVIALFVGKLGFQSFLYLFWPIIYMIYGIPLGLLFSWLSGIGVPFIWMFSAIISLMVAIGDPFTYFLHKKRPDLVPVERYKIFNLTPIIFVLDRGDESPSTYDQSLNEIRNKILN